VCSGGVCVAEGCVCVCVVEGCVCVSVCVCVCVAEGCGGGLRCWGLCVFVIKCVCRLWVFSVVVRLDSGNRFVV